MTPTPAPAPAHAPAAHPLRWREVERAAPELAAAVLARFRSARHHVLATLARDGSPRVSGTEVDLWRGDLVIGSMVGARKALDLRRDPRFALHAHTGDGSMAGGDAKVSGTAAEVVDDGELRAFADDRHAPEPFQLFRLLLTSVVLTELDGDGLRISALRPGAGVSVVRRT